MTTLMCMVVGRHVAFMAWLFVNMGFWVIIFESNTCPLLLDNGIILRIVKLLLGGLILFHRLTYAEIHIGLGFA